MGSADLLIQKFFSRLQDKYNVNTVPTVIKLTNKLLKVDYSASEYPFCPLCLGVRDTITNMLEIGSNIQSLSENTVTRITSPDQWFQPEDQVMQKALCYGCKRMLLSAGGKSKEFREGLPEFIKENSLIIFNSQ